jgi:hypothetical protein
MFVLVFTGPYDAVPRAIGYHIYAAKMLDRFLDYLSDRSPGTHIAKGTEAVIMPVLHGLEGVFEGSADGDDEVILIQT